MNTHELWQSTLGELELTLSKAHFTTWFRNTFIAEYENGAVIIGVPNTFTKAWLEKKYHRDILEAIQNITEQTIRQLEYRVETRQQPPAPVILKKEPTVAEAVNDVADEDFGFTTQTQKTAGNIQINPNHTFDTFVVGKQNELAHAAAQAVAAQPGGTYNPLFIYGGVGLGKTHLLQAVGNTVRDRNQNARILYVSCEQFTNDFIQSVRAGKAKEFKDRYRNVDLLLIDDIQFITGKEGTQEEFFHTFNALHQDNKQIVISSDRPPKAIASLEKRLLSRLEWGMLVDIGAPDLETRVAILQIKCQNKNIELEREILHFIASNIQSNVRELEGALTKIVAFHEFKNIMPTIETIEPLISSFGVENLKKTVTPAHIIDIVINHYDITKEEVLGKSREKRLAFPRQVIMYLLREEMKSSYPSIGQALGGRDHTTAMHAYTKIEKLLKEEEDLQRTLDEIKQKLYSG